MVDSYVMYTAKSEKIFAFLPKNQPSKKPRFFHQNTWEQDNCNGKKSSSLLL